MQPAGAPDVYVMQVVMDLTGDVDRDRFVAAAGALLARYDGLRTSFRTTADGRAVQLVPSSAEVPWVDVDLRGHDDIEGDLRVELETERDRRFSMDSAPLVRFRMIRTADDAVTLSFMAHHIVIDGWSMPLVLKDLLTLYALRGDASLLPEVRSYRSFLEWLSVRDRAVSVKAWTTAFAGAEEPTLLSGITDTSGVSTDTGRVEVVMDEKVTSELTDLGSRLGVTLSTIVQAAWGLVLARQLGRDDVAFGGTVSGRPADLEGVETMVGLFINTLPVRVRIDESDSIESFLLRLQEEQTALLDHHYLGLADITTAVGPGAVFDSITVLESYPVDEEGLKAAASIDGMAVTGAQVLDATHYPINVVTFADTQIRMTLRYLRDLFSDEYVSALGSRLQAVFAAFATAPGAPVGRIETLLADERTDLLSRRGSADVDERTLVRILEDAADHAPSRLAVRQGSRSGRTRSSTLVPRASRASSSTRVSDRTSWWPWRFRGRPSSCSASGRSPRRAVTWCPSTRHTLPSASTTWCTTRRRRSASRRSPTAPPTSTGCGGSSSTTSSSRPTSTPARPSASPTVSVSAPYA